MASKGKSNNILIRGADGRLYAISSADLEQYVIPEEQAQEIEEKLHLADQSVVTFEVGDEDSDAEVNLSASFTTASFVGKGFTKGGFTKASFTTGKALTFVNISFVGRKKK